jgi:hypothetical protein
MRALALQKWPLLKLENALSQNVSTTNSMVFPLTLIDLMRESEDYLHPTMEIR